MQYIYDSKILRFKCFFLFFNIFNSIVSPNSRIFFENYCLSCTNKQQILCWAPTTLAKKLFHCYYLLTQTNSISCSLKRCHALGRMPCIERFEGRLGPLILGPLMLPCPGAADLGRPFLKRIFPIINSYPTPTRTQVNPYPIPSRTQTNSYPSQLVPKSDLDDDCSAQTK